MNISEILEGSGVYKVPIPDLPDWRIFIRCDQEEGRPVPPLLHVCERENLQRESGEYYACITGRVVWNWAIGQYECRECKGEFNTDEELFMVWEDGHGTGVEGVA